MTRSRFDALRFGEVLWDFFWTSVLRIGHMMGMKAVSRPGAVSGLVRLHAVRAALDGLRRSVPGRTLLA